MLRPAKLSLVQQLSNRKQLAIGKTKINLRKSAKFAAKEIVAVAPAASLIQFA